MDEKDIKAIRQGVARGLSQYLQTDDEAPVELRLLLHSLQRQEMPSEVDVAQPLNETD